MMARAASEWCSRPSWSAAAPIPRVTLSISSGSPITPVDEMSTCSGWQSSARARAAAIWTAFCKPASPVQALAHPLLTTMARARPADAARWLRHTTTGAATARLVVKTAATLTGRSAAMRARSNASFLIPHATAAQRKPWAAVTPPSTGLTGLLTGGPPSSPHGRCRRRRRIADTVGTTRSRGSRSRSSLAPRGAGRSRTRAE